MNKKEYCVLSVVSPHCYGETLHYFEAKAIADRNIEYVGSIGYISPEIYNKKDTIEVMWGLNVVRMPKVGAVPCYSEIRQFNSPLKFLRLKKFA